MGLFSSFHDAITRKAYLIHRPHLWPNDRHDFAIFLSVEINKVMDNHDKQHQTPIRLAVSLYQQTLSFNPDDDEIEALAKSVVAGAILSGLVLENLKTIKANPHIEGIYFRKASDIFDRLIAHCGKVYGLNPRSGAEKLVAIALEHTQIKDFMKSWPIYARPFLYATDNRVASRPKPEKVEPEVKTLYSDGKNSLTVSSAENPQLPGLPYSVSSTANGIDITFHTNPDLFPPPTPPEPAVSKGRDSIACDVTPDAEPPPSEGSNSDNSRNVIDFLNPLTWPKNSEELMTAIVEAIAKLEAFDKGNASPGREAGFRLFLDSKFNNVIIPMRFQRIKWLALSHAESDPARKVPGNPYLYGYNRLFEFIRACTPILHTEHLQALRENIGYPWGINTYGWEVGKENEAETPTAAPNKGVGCLALFFLLVLFSIASKALGLPGLFGSPRSYTPPRTSPPAASSRGASARVSAASSKSAAGSATGIFKTAREWSSQAKNQKASPSKPTIASPFAGKPLEKPSSPASRQASLSAQSKRSHQITIGDSSIAIPIPKGYVLETGFPSIQKVPGVGAIRYHCIYTKDYPKVGIMDSLSISNLIALDSLYMDRTHFTALKAEIRKNAQEKTAAFYKQQQSSDPYAREVVGEVEIFVDEENYIGAYFVTTGHTAFGTAYSYHACVNVILKGHLLNADYVALSPIPRKDIPRVVKKTAVGWINAILLANEH